jgi:hypothetical protein
MVPTSLKELFFFAIILSAGGLLYFLGNWLFGAANNGGKRLLLFIIGVLVSAMGGGVCVGFVMYEAHWTLSVVLALIFGSAFLFFGLYLINMSFFASRDGIAKLFDQVISGL